MHKGQHLLICIMFFCLFFIALLMGMAGPRIITEHTDKATDLKSHNNKTNIPSGPFTIVTPSLSNYRQQLWISAQVITAKEKEQEMFTKKCHVFLQVKGLLDKSKSVLIGGQSHNRTRTIRCDDEKCDSFIIMHLGVLEYSHYLVNISFTGLDSVDKHFHIKDIIFNTITYNPEFTRMEIWFRFFFVVVSVIISILFLLSMRNFFLHDWSIEQKWVAVLLPLLLNFNNPLFSLTLTSSSLFSPLIDAFFQISFLMALLLFWLCIFHSLRQTERGLYTFYMGKFILVGLLWFTAMTMTVLEETNQLRDPSFSYQLNTAHYKNFQRCFVGILAIYIVYLVYLALRAFGELRSMNFLDARLKFHSASLIVVLFLTLSIVFNRYGYGVLEDNFVARIYTSYNSEGQFLALYTVLNCYIYVLAYVYTPTSAQTRENHLLRDNPAFSMINESDDDETDETEAMLIKTEDSSETNESSKIMSNEHNLNLMSDFSSSNNISTSSRRPLILGHDDDSD